LMYMPTLEANGVLMGYYRTTAAGAFEYEIPGTKLFSEMLIPLDKSVSPLVRRPAEEMETQLWGDEDLRKFQIKTEPKPEAEPPHSTPASDPNPTSTSKAHTEPKPEAEPPSPKATPEPNPKPTSKARVVKGMKTPYTENIRPRRDQQQ
jgi:hypothetical protein